VSDLDDLAALVVSWARPGEEVEAYVSRSRTTNVRAYNGEVESFSSAEPAGTGIRVVVDGRQGFAWAGTLDVDVLRETLAEARDNAAFGQPDEHAGLARPDGIAVPELDLVRAELLTTPTAAKVDMALELERATKARDRRVTGVRVATYSDAYGETAVATTTGITATSTAGLCFLSVSPLVEDRGDTQMGSGVSAGRALSELDPDRAATDGVERAVRLLGATKPASRRVTVVLDPEVTADLLQILGSTLSGEAVLKGRSLFAGREGSAVASDAVTLVSDPTDAGAFDSGHVDGEGLARRRVPLIESGALRQFLYDTTSGRRAGRPSTASAARGYSSTPTVGAPALTLAPGTRRQDELISGITDGVYVQEVSGLHSGVNPVSGDFSVGATGLAIRDGALAEPFREATVASTLQRMLLDIVEVGADHEWLPGGAAGVTLVVRDVSLSGT